MTEAQYLTQQCEEDEDVDERKLDLSNQSTSSQFHVTYDPVVTVLKREWDDLHKRIIDLEAQLEANYQRLYKAMQPFVAGGSEYTEWSGIERGIRTIGERMRTATKREIAEIQERKRLERQRDDLQNALIAIRDEFDLGCEKWCAANGLIPPAEFQVDGTERFVAREALRRLEGEAANDESHADSTTQK